MLSLPQRRTLNTLLRYGLEQIQEAQTIVVSDTAMLRTLRDIEGRIRDVLGLAERALLEAEKAERKTRQ
jgi:hypothetical protein